MKAEFYALKSFVMDEIYNINRSIDRVRTECDHSQCKKDMGVELQTKNKIIKTLLENYNNITNLSYKRQETHGNQVVNDEYFQCCKSKPSQEYHEFNKRNKYVKSKSNCNGGETPNDVFSFNRFSILQNNDCDVQNELRVDDEIVVFSNNKNVENIQRPGRRPQVVVNQHPENQTVFNKKLPLVPGKKSYSESVKGRSTGKDVFIFSDSLPKGIRMYEFNK